MTATAVETLHARGLAWADAMQRSLVEATILLPTLGVAVEYDLRDDVELSYASLRAFNRWLEQDWGYGDDGRIFAVPMLSLLDIDQAVLELERVIAAGARMVHLCTGPIAGRSPADPHFDPFWARCAEASMWWWPPPAVPST